MLVDSLKNVGTIHEIVIDIHLVIQTTLKEREKSVQFMFSKSNKETSHCLL